MAQAPLPVPGCRLQGRQAGGQRGPVDLAAEAVPGVPEGGLHRAGGGVGMAPGQFEVGVQLGPVRVVGLG